MNYKSIVVFILLFFMQSVPAMERPIWVSGGSIVDVDPKIYAENQYNYVGFERLPRQVSCAKAVNSAFRLLQKKGKLVSFVVPSSDFLPASLLPNGIKVVESGATGIMIYATMSKYMSFSNASTDLETSFLIGCRNCLLEFFALDPKEATIEFSTVLPEAERWNKKYIDKNEEDEKLKMIITRL